jgi:hypothetical protein
MQSIYFCKTLDLELIVYVPDAVRFMMYFDHTAVQVDLDQSYLSDPETALERARALAAEAGLKPLFLSPKNRTASSLPDIPTHFQFMCCPRSVSDASSKNRLITNLLFGSKMEIAQHTLTNAMPVSGPRTTVHLN